MFEEIKMFSSLSRRNWINIPKSFIAAIVASTQSTPDVSDIKRHLHHATRAP